MYELARVRLHSVGPKGARYDDIVLDFRHVGPPVAAPARRALFDGADAGSPRRPSPASVIFAENGNGKSVLIKLIFSVMLPGRRQIVGTTNTRVLDDFVLADDVAHVILEWQHTRTGQRVITGKTSAWRGHVVSSDPAKLTEGWWSLRPTAGVDLDTLPLTEQGRRVELGGFRDRLTEAQRREPHLQFEWLKAPSEWTDHLGTLDLDSKLFGYQRTMNAGEGEAAGAFAFKSDEAFVDWLLRAVADDEEPKLLAELIDTYADRLAERTSMIAERDFVGGALERLEPLAAAAKEAAAAEELSDAVAGEAVRFVRALQARHAEETARLEVLDVRRGTTTGRLELADRENRRMNRIVLELRRDRAHIEWRLAEEHLKELSERLAGQRADLEAWKATDALLVFQRAQGAAKAVRDVVASKEAEAEAPLRARDAAAMKLVQGLLAVIDQATAENTRLTGLARDLDSEIRDLGEQESGYREAVGKEKALAAAALAKITDARDAVTAAVTAGLLDTGRVPAEAAEEAEAAADEAGAAVKSAEDRLAGLTDERKLVDKAVRDAERAVDAHRSALADAERVLTEAQTATAELAGDERLAALLGTDSVLLEADFPALLARLADVIGEDSAEERKLQVDDAADRDVLQALETTDLLPPRPDVTSVSEVLEAAGIRAYSGWDYLANTAESLRGPIMAAHPQLVDGIVLNKPDDVNHARQALAAARLLPRSLVVVGTTETLGSAESDGTIAGAYVVPPNPAMYDVDLAAAERARLLAVVRERATRLDALSARLEDDRALVTRLKEWQNTWPPGTIECLISERDTAQDNFDEAESWANQLRSRLDEIIEAEDTETRSLPALRSAERAASERSRSLATLAQLVANEPTWSREYKQAQETAEAAERAAEATNTTAEGLRGEKSDLLRKADDQVRTRATAQDEVGKIPGGGSADRAADPPGEALEVLRSTYAAAKTAYEQVEVGADLRADLDLKLTAEADARAALEKLPDQVRARATELLAEPDGADPAARTAATLRTGRAIDTLDEQVGRAGAEAGSRKNAYESHQAQEVSMEPYGRPRDLAHADELLAVASDDYLRARDTAEGVQGELNSLDKTIEVTKKTADGFDSIGDSVSDLAGETDDDTPYRGTLEAAKARRTSVRTSVSEAKKILTSAQSEVSRLSSGLGRYAVGSAFAEVDSPVRQQMIAVDRDRLADYADDWATALKPRLRSLTDDLAQIDRHRTEIVVRLRGMVDIAVKTLRTAEKVSTLPEALGDWAGLHFLRIRFTDLDTSVLDDRLGDVVDEAAAHEVVKGSRGGPGKRDGMTLLLKGVRAAMPKGVRVDMLKPDAALRAERVRVAAIADVFSGGQLLTAAIILYCTMAALRSNERGQLRRPHAGVLFLDNPIGRASAGYLLDLQIGVADALGVQLIYTTGLFDINALSLFPLIVRLRNDRDLRSGMAYLTVEDEIRAGLPPAGDPDQGQLTAARLFRRPIERPETA
ncbi:hypothetical protein [Amycolatopsis sp. NPDC051371]|uniref:hypothetical protein n=1 Tax=Amycolatopsis sp. NPDC051371 TaxID=3155800 RepID=UPI003441420D